MGRIILFLLLLSGSNKISYIDVDRIVIEECYDSNNKKQECKLAYTQIVLFRKYLVPNNPNCILDYKVSDWLLDDRFKLIRQDKEYTYFCCNVQFKEKDGSYKDRKIIIRSKIVEYIKTNLEVQKDIEKLNKDKFDERTRETYFR